MTNRKMLGAIALTALLTTAGCGKTTPGNTANASNATTAEPANEVVPQVEANVATAPAAEEVAANDITPVKNLVAAHQGGVVRPGPAIAAATKPAAARPTGFLARYVDMHPREVEDGRSFLGEPAVRKAVAANVRDAGVRDFIFHFNGPDAPIAAKGGRILAWGCEAHNCGFHNWAVSITPDGSSAEVCYYHDDDRPDGAATWYLPHGKTVKRAGNCPDD